MQSSVEVPLEGLKRSNPFKPLRPLQSPFSKLVFRVDSGTDSLQSLHLEHERNYGLDMDAAVIACTWNMVWPGCCGDRML